jgi:hypothetical protein
VFIGIQQNSATWHWLFCRKSGLGLVGSTELAEVAEAAEAGLTTLLF